MSLHPPTMDWVLLPRPILTRQPRKDSSSSTTLCSTTECTISTFGLSSPMCQSLLDDGPFDATLRERYFLENGSSSTWAWGVQSDSFAGSN